MEGLGRSEVDIFFRFIRLTYSDIDSARDRCVTMGEAEMSVP